MTRAALSKAAKAEAEAVTLRRIAQHVCHFAHGACDCAARRPSDRACEAAERVARTVVAMVVGGA